LAQPEALRVIDADFPNHLEGRAVLDALGDGAGSHHVSDLVDRLDHGALDAVLADSLHELAVDLEVVDRQVAQVRERG
jgi:hypothetical protein